MTSPPKCVGGTARADVRGRAARPGTGQRQRSLLRLRAAPRTRVGESEDLRSARQAATNGRILAGEPHHFARTFDRHPHQRRVEHRGVSHQAPARPHAVHTVGPLNAKAGSRSDARTASRSRASTRPAASSAGRRR